MRALAFGCLLMMMTLPAFGQQDDALKKSFFTADDSQKAEIGNGISKSYISAYRFDSAIQYSLLARHFASQYEDDDQAGIAWKNLGIISYLQGKYDSAMYCYRLAFEYLTTAGNLLEQGNIVNNAAVIHLLKGEYDEAARLHFLALEIRKSIHHTYGIGSSYLNLGNLYNDLQQYDRAIEYHQLALAQFMELNDPELISTAYNNLGSTYTEARNFEKALENHQKALLIRQKIGNPILLAQSYLNMGNSYSNLGEDIRALGFLKRADSLYAVLDYPEGKLLLYHSMGLIYDDLKQPERGISYLEKAFAIAEAIDTKQYMKYTSESLYYLYKKQGRYQEAMEFLKIASDLEAQELKADHTRILAETEARYKTKAQSAEIEKLEKEKALSNAITEKQELQLKVAGGGALLLLILTGILFRNNKLRKKHNQELGDKNREIEAQKIALGKSLEEKESLLKEIHHRVKNNLQVVSSLLSLQTEYVKAPEALLAVKEGQSRVKSMALLHQHLYEQENLTGIRMQDYFAQLTRELSLSYGGTGDRCRITVTAGDIRLDSDRAIPLGLMVNELVTNSYKYALPAQPELEISVSLAETVEGSAYLLKVSDNGPGFPAGLEPEKANSLGLKLVRMLTMQLRGKVEFLNEDGALTKIWF